MWFSIIQKYYSKGLYTNEQVKTFVVAGYITEVRYKEITGIEYVA